MKSVYKLSLHNYLWIKASQKTNTHLYTAPMAGTLKVSLDTCYVVAILTLQHTSSVCANVCKSSAQLPWTHSEVWFVEIKSDTQVQRCFRLCIARCHHWEHQYVLGTNSLRRLDKVQGICMWLDKSPELTCEVSFCSLCKSTSAAACELQILQSITQQVNIREHVHL
jgi:hypothetical protein